MALATSAVPFPAIGSAAVPATAHWVTLPDGRRAFTASNGGTYVPCDGTWDCPRKRRAANRIDREHTLDFAD